MQFSDLILNELQSVRGEDESIRWEFRLDGLGIFEGESQLNHLLAAWDALREGDTLPRADRFRATSIFGEYDSLSLTLVNMRWLGELHVLRRGTMHTPISEVVQNRLQRECLESDIRDVVLNRAPAYHHIEERFAGHHARYTRLLLPLVEQSGIVVEALCGENHAAIPFVVRLPS